MLTEHKREDGADRPRSLWGALTSSIVFELVQHDNHTSRLLGGAGVTAAEPVSGPNLSLGLHYDLRPAEMVGVTRRLRYLPIFNVAEEPDRGVLHGIRGNLQLVFRASKRAQPYLRVSAGSVDPTSTGAHNPPELATFVNGLFGFRVRWPVRSN